MFIISYCFSFHCLAFGDCARGQRTHSVALRVQGEIRYSQIHWTKGEGECLSLLHVCAFNEINYYSVIAGAVYKAGAMYKPWGYQIILCATFHVFTGTKIVQDLWKWSFEFESCRSPCTGFFPAFLTHLRLAAEGRTELCLEWSIFRQDTASRSLSYSKISH